MGRCRRKFPTVSVASAGGPCSWLALCWRGLRGWPGRARDGGPGRPGLARGRRSLARNRRHDQGAVGGHLELRRGGGVRGHPAHGQRAFRRADRLGRHFFGAGATVLGGGAVRCVRSGLGGRALLRRDAVRSVLGTSRGRSVVDRGRRVVGEPLRGRPGFQLHGRGIFFLWPGCGSRHAGQGQRRPLDRRQHGGQFRARPDPGLLPFLLLIDLRGGRIEPVIHRAHTPGSRPELAGTVCRVEEYQTCDNDENEQLSHVSRHHWRAFGMTPSLCEAVSAPGWLRGGVGPD